MSRNISELDVLDLQKQGQKLYRQHKFEDALKCFDQAILSDRELPTELFDNRAAVYTRLGRLKPALRDGRRMIGQDKSNGTGYLRTGKILQLLGNPNAALNVYQLGLRKIEPNDPNTKLLQGLHNRLAKQCAPSKAIDPFQILPIEIVDIIIKYFDFRKTIRILRVSKSWRDLLSSMPKLWADLNFSNCKKQVTMSAVRQYVKNAQGNCSTIRLDRFAETQENILRYVASRCRGLRDVRLLSGCLGGSLLSVLWNTINLQSLIVSSSCSIASKIVTELLARCTNLERAEFHEAQFSRQQGRSHWPSMPKMQTLVINASEKCLGLLHFPNLLMAIRNIRSLTLRHWEDIDFRSQALDFSHLLLLEHLDIAGVLTGLPPKLPASIRNFDMTRCTAGNFRDIITGPGPYEPPVLPNLSSFSIGHSMLYLPTEVLEILAANKDSLRTVDLSGFSVAEDQIPIIISDGCLAKVEQLRLRESQVCDGVALLIAYNMPRLKQLDVAHTDITGVGVKVLLTKLKDQLEWLGLDQCQGTSVDAVELARSMGIKVSYNFPDQKGGKKIRLH